MIRFMFICSSFAPDTRHGAAGRTENRSDGRRFRVAGEISLLSNQARVFLATTNRSYEAIMRLLYIGTISAFLAICLTLPAHAQDSLRLGEPTPSPGNSPAMQTGKERLSRKWMDEQRIDNCNVPIDKRGSKPRPSDCPHIPTR
jgi:hypothetical protein